MRVGQGETNSTEIGKRVLQGWCMFTDCLQSLCGGSRGYRTLHRKHKDLKVRWESDCVAQHGGKTVLGAE